MIKKKMTMIIAAIVIILVVVVAIILISLGIGKKETVEVEVYEEPVDIYNETVEFTEEIIEERSDENLKQLDNFLKEYRNDEYGVRFGYPIEMELPIDEIDASNFFHSKMTTKDKGKNVELLIGELDNTSASGEYIQELISGIKQKDSSLNVSYGLFENQMSVKLKYKIDDLKYSQNITIKDKTFYSLTYFTTEKEYDEIEAQKIFDSFSFVISYKNYPKTSLRSVKINGENYDLPVKISTVKNLNISPSYVNEILKPNYFSVVSLYEIKNIKYSAYVYNAKASEANINTGYLIGIETDKFKGGDIEILDSIKIGTLRQEVKNTLGEPRNEYSTQDDTVLVSTYSVEDATIEFKYKATDGKTIDDMTPVYGISIRFKR